MKQGLEPSLIYGVIIGYFILLFLIGRWTKGKGDNESFFTSNRNSPWYLVAFGMIGASLSGVTFISVPGKVGYDGLNSQFAYMQMVFGYVLGYFLIAKVLLPIYYKYNITTIYEFLQERIGLGSYKTGSAFFILSRLIGASFRLYLVASVLQLMLMDALGVPFFLTTLVTLMLILIYTYEGGIKTIVITDTLQTAAMLLAVIITIGYLMQHLGLDLGSLYASISEAGIDQMFFFDNGWSNPNNFWKQFISGMFITIVMTGLDQDMMQKNLTCRNLGDAQKNMYTFSIVLVFANVLFLTMGALLYMYALDVQMPIPAKPDALYPEVALNYLPTFAGVLFLIGLLAAAYSSADSALTSLTTAFCIDFLNFKKNKVSEEKNKKMRIWVHLGFSYLLLLIILWYRQIDDGSVLNALFTAAQYTYGPILALFIYAIRFDKKLPDVPVVIICILSPILTYIIDHNSVEWFNGFTFGFLGLLLNAAIAYTGLWTLGKFYSKE